MGLAKAVATRFPTWGPEFATLMVIIQNSLLEYSPVYSHRLALDILASRLGLVSCKAL